MAGSRPSPASPSDSRWIEPARDRPRHSWAVVFYLFALGLNHRHYMATAYRAYHTRAEFATHRIQSLRRHGAESRLVLARYPPASTR